MTHEELVKKTKESLAEVLDNANNNYYCGLACENVSLITTSKQDWYVDSRDYIFVAFDPVYIELHSRSSNFKLEEHNSFGTEIASFNTNETSFDSIAEAAAVLIENHQYYKK